MNIRFIFKGVFAIACLAVANASVAVSDINTSITAGFAQSHASVNSLNANGDLSGFNTKARVEFDDKWGLIGTYTHTDKSFNDGDLQYNSFGMGPSFRLSEFISLYATLGTARGEIKSHYYDGSAKETAFVGGFGFQFNPVNSAVLDVSYEYTTFNQVDVGTWVIGGGIRF